MWTQALVQIFSMMLPPVLVALIYYRGVERDFLLLDFGGDKWLLALAGVVVMLLLVPLNEWLTQWNDTWNLGALGDSLRTMQERTEGVIEQIVDTSSVGGLLANLLVVALVPAVAEELFFRCGIQNLIGQWVRNRHVAIWLTALIFSLAHGEVFSFMPRFMLGAMLGYLYEYGRSVVPNMLAHFANNAIVVVLYWLVARGATGIDPEAPFNFPVILTVCCTLAAVLLFVATFTKTLKK